MNTKTIDQAKLDKLIKAINFKAREFREGDWCNSSPQYRYDCWSCRYCGTWTTHKKDRRNLKHHPNCLTTLANGITI